MKYLVTVLSKAPKSSFAGCWATTSSQRDYLMGQFETTETAPVFAGDTDNPFLFGNDGETVSITNNFIAQVSYTEQNARWTRAPAAVPEPATLSMFVLGLLGLGIARRRS